MKHNVFTVFTMLTVMLCVLVSIPIKGQNRVSKSLAIRAAMDNSMQLKMIKYYQKTYCKIAQHDLHSPLLILYL